MKLAGNGSGPHEGNIFVGGLPVCDDYHDAQNALVVCRFAKNRGMRIFGNRNKNLPRMLGYSFGQPTSQSQFGSVPSTFGMDNVQCIGNETSFLDCPHLTVDDCEGHEGAGVICSNTGMLQALRRNDRTAFLGDIIVHIFLINLQ